MHHPFSNRLAGRIAAVALSLAIGSPCLATFDLMQIERVIGGVNGDTTLQAIQLRLRASFQNAVSGGRLRVWDASGNNPVIIKNFLTNVPFYSTDYMKTDF